jgi:hypothetical protein
VTVGISASSRRGIAVAAAVVAAGIAVAVVSAHGSSPQDGGAHTVTYVTSGDAADANVTYGPAGSALQGSVPMQASDQLGTATYYAIDAQLQGDGTVSCQILIDGTVVSSASAFGGYELARCEVIRDPSGNWTDANSAG